MAGAYVAAGLVAYLIPNVLQWSAAEAKGWFQTIRAQFVFVLLAEITIVAVVLWFIRHRKASPRIIGFLRRPRWSDAGWVLVTFGAYFIAVTALTALAKAVFHIDLEQKQELGFDAVISNGDKILTFVSLVVLPPIAEEFLFRGFLFTGLRKKMTFMWTAVITSILFASLHLAEGASGLLWVAGIDTFVLSIILCYLREKTGNLWAGMMLHAIKNGIAFAYLYIFIPR
jgi:membrane protease YdiL (CAAX protease family)